MKLSTATLEVLKNFSNINQSIAVTIGSKLKTVNSLKNILAHAKVEEDFPKGFAIYDLTKFLGLLSTMDDPDLSFNDNDVIISSGTTQCDYRYADIDYIVKPEKDIDMPECEIQFTLKKDVFTSMENSATVLQLNDIYFKGCEKSGKIIMGATNKKNDSEHGLSMEVGEGVTNKFNVVLKKENLKIIPGDYNVAISSKGISHFKHTELELEYWIALEPTSDYE